MHMCMCALIYVFRLDICNSIQKSYSLTIKHFREKRYRMCDKISHEHMLLTGIDTRGKVN
jgi:hypothetical protein